MNIVLVLNVATKLFSCLTCTDVLNLSSQPVAVIRLVYAFALSQNCTTAQCPVYWIKRHSHCARTACIWADSVRVYAPIGA